MLNNRSSKLKSKDDFEKTLRGKVVTNLKN